MAWVELSEEEISRIISLLRRQIAEDEKLRDLVNYLINRLESEV